MKTGLKRIQIIAHQGASGYAPENTLPAFEKAIELGADWIELDVHRVEDQLFIIHDYRLDHLTNQKGNLYTLPIETIRKALVRNSSPIPTLQEVLDLVDKRVKINIEIKSSGTAELVLKAIDEYVKHHNWNYSHFLISSFNQYEILRVNEINPEIATGVIIYGLPLGLAEFTQKLKVQALINCIEFTNFSIIESAHRYGLNYYVYTVNYRDDIKRMLDLNVDGIITNYPDRVKEILSNYEGDYQNF